jgi:large subunit ribosomal protein L14e
MYDVGRVCLKIAGREAGKYCVIVKKIDEKFVLVTGPRNVTRVKRRRCNIGHLEPLQETIKIRSDAPDEDVEKAFEAGSIYTKLSIEKPSIRVKAREKAGPRKEEKAKAEKPEERKKKQGKAKDRKAEGKKDKQKAKKEKKKPAKKEKKPAAKARKKK